MMDGFRSRVTKLTDNRVQVITGFHKRRRVIHTRDDDELHHSTIISDAADEKQYKWLTSIEEFRDAMLRMHEALKVKQPQKIKVTPIDDGLDYSDFEMGSHTKVRGISYYLPSGPRGKTEHPWH
ncbi:uncharacterized protein BO97DRAFT_443547 [Aspergillus homomorphus CBS 101889]|uniref:Uncharacterized protein n=1 Tax=Aspergillus homomorphus (strain CBS 101889) TaxID=1450537 RepID=A0A395HWM7_ASPHC|nr:hypothetical protein BO97DRAFT_443547 [Aspergillus homomorphus CBS 101889]RAL11825.1 hypothetical protein BO97DRAFT_443547 [Aspergillus homomorphus CBS 101889]